MKTNQMMTVKINDELSFEIGHKDMMGKANEVFNYGNALRKSPVSVIDFLRSNSTVELIVAIHEHKKELQSVTVGYPIGLNFGLDSTLCTYTSQSGKSYKFDLDSRGRISVTNLYTQFPII